VLCFLGLALIGAEPGPVLPQCSDGIDNDGDGFTDEEDAKCILQLQDTYHCPLWDSETDPIMYTNNDDFVSYGCTQI
jgi:hypothetical protein